MLHALHYHSSGFFIFMSPAKDLHFSALVCLVIVAAWLSQLFRAKFSLLFRKINIKSDQFLCTAHCIAGKTGNEHADYKFNPL